MSVYASEEQQRELEYLATMEARNESMCIEYDYDDYYDYECDSYVINNSKSNKRKDYKLVKFPMSSLEDNMKNKKCDYKTLAIMTLYSKANLESHEKHRFIYKHNMLLVKDEIEKLSNNKIDTICRNIKKLCKLESKVVEAKNTDNGIVYIINYSTEEENKNGELVNRKYVPIEEDILRVLLDAGSSNLIKTYILIKYRCADKNYNSVETKITRMDIAENIGLSPKSDNNLKTVKNLVFALKRLGLIEVNKKYVTEVLDNGNESVKCFNFFKTIDYEDWLKIYKKEK